VHDLFFIGFLAALFGLGLRRPFLMVVLYVYIDEVQPQQLTYYLLNSISISMIAGAAALAGWALFDDKSHVRIAPRQILILLLIGICGYTTAHADFPIEAADTWSYTWKGLAFAAFLPLTLRTRLRIETLLLFMVLSAGAIIIVGGIKTAVSGGGYGELDLMVNNNSGLYEGSTISAVAIALVPVILWFTRYGTIFPPDARVKAFAWALCVACLLIPVGTSARTGLLCIGLLGLLMWLKTRRKLLYAGLTIGLGMAAVPFLPTAYTQRMNTIKTYDSDESASTRLAVWAWTLDYAKAHPLGGGFYAFKQNHLRMQLKGDAATGQSAHVETDQARAWHSAYFQMLGEQGYLGLIVWLSINLGGVVRMEVVRRRYRDPDGPYAWGGALAQALQFAHLIFLLGAGFVGIALQPFVFMIVGAQIGLDTYLARQRAAAGAGAAFGRRAAPALAV
jgi:probable O-glycosylation ligase (exosortase A-associated)